MAARYTTRALRGALKQCSQPRVQQRAFGVAASAARPMLQRAAAPAQFVQQTRGKKTVDFAGDKEVVYGMLSVSRES